MSPQNNYKRRQAQRSIRKVLVVCEGVKTEPNYFKSFQIDGELIKVDIHGTGRNKASLVEKAIELKKIAESKNEPYASVWCVFDRDLHPEDPNDKNNFNRAVQLARNNRIRAIYSNDAFELWYILHFNYHQSAWNRDRYIDELTKLLNLKYEKNDPAIYAKLINKQSVAIRNAKKLLEYYGSDHNPESDNPCTVVHILVEFLNDYLEGE